MKNSLHLSSIKNKILETRKKVATFLLFLKFFKDNCKIAYNTGTEASYIIVQFASLPFDSQGNFVGTYIITHFQSSHKLSKVRTLQPVNQMWLSLNTTKKFQLSPY